MLWKNVTTHHPHILSPRPFFGPNHGINLIIAPLYIAIPHLVKEFFIHLTPFLLCIHAFTDCFCCCLHPCNSCILHHLIYYIICMYGCLLALLLCPNPCQYFKCWCCVMYSSLTSLCGDLTMHVEKMGQCFTEWPGLVVRNIISKPQVLGHWCLDDGECGMLC